MRILYGITKSNWGGAQRYVFDLASEAKRRGENVSVLAGGEGLLINKLKSAGIRVIPLSNLGRDISFLADIKSFFQILSILRKEKPNIFHINSSKMGGIGVLAGRIAGVKKIIFTAHGWAFNESRIWFQKTLIKKLVWLTILLSHKTICVSEKTREDIAWLPFIGKKLALISNGIDNFETKPRSHNDTLVVGTIAELHKIKGLDILLEAWQRFKQNNPGKLVIIGSGEEEKNLLELSHKLNISSSVEFRGFVENARSCLSQFDIFVLPSRSEALPYAPLEAGLASLPVIATTVGGVPEIIKDGETGLLIPKEDPEALARALDKLVRDKDLRKTLGHNLNKFVRERFSQERMLQETFKLYGN